MMISCMSRAVLFESSDAELLRSLPITAKRLTHARLTGLAVLLSPVLLLFMPLAVFYGMVADTGPAYYAVAVLFLALFGLTVLGVGALLTCLLALSVPARGLRGLSKYGTLLILFPCGLAAFMLMPMLPQLNDMMDQMLAIADRVAVGPIAWIVDGLAGFAGDSGIAAALPAAALLACAAGSWGACLALAPRLSARDVIESAPVTVGTVSGLGWWAPGWLDSVSRALWRREKEEPALALQDLAQVVKSGFPKRLRTLRAELELYRSRRPAIGDAALFPAPKKPGEPFDSDLAAKWLVRAEKKAKLPKLAGGRWHPYRRLFATELAHVPAKTAAMLGGWKNPATMQRLYQQPTGESLYAAAMEVGKSG